MGNTVKISKGKTWPGAVIPFEIDPTLSERQTDDVIGGMAYWEQETPLRFLPRDATRDDYWVRFTHAETACHSGVGRKKSKKGEGQEITVDGGCTVPSVAHEIGHAIGMHHEQYREDRDDHIIIYRENIRSGLGGSIFSIKGEMSGAYDYRSIMHYGAWGSRKEDVHRWANGYDKADHFVIAGTGYVMLYRHDDAAYLLLEVLPGGQLREVRADTFDKRWTFVDTTVVDGVPLQIRSDAFQGRFEIWRLDESAVPLDKLRSYSYGISTWGRPGIDNFGGPIANLYLCDLERNVCTRNTLSPDGTLSFVNNHVFEGEWTEYHHVNFGVMPVFLMVNRNTRSLARCIIDGTELRQLNNPSGFLAFNWDAVAFTNVREDATTSEWLFDMITVDADAGLIVPFRFRVDPIGPELVMSFLPRVSVDAGHNVILPYDADGDTKILTMGRRNAPGTRFHNNGVMVSYDYDRDSGTVGDEVPITDPVMERKNPETPDLRFVLGNTVLSESDRDTADTLLDGNVEIFESDSDDELRRMGIVHHPWNLTDCQTWEGGGVRYLFAGNGANGKYWTHNYDQRGKPSGRTRVSASLPKWRSCAIYRDGNGDNHAIFNNRNSQHVRIHRVDSRVDPDPAETINGHGKWHNIVPLQYLDRRFLLFIRDNGEVCVQRINDDGSLGDKLERKIAKNITSAAVMVYGTVPWIVFAVKNGRPQIHGFSTRTGISATTKTNTFIPNGRWNHAFQYRNGIAGIYDAKAGRAVALSLGYRYAASASAKIPVRAGLIGLHGFTLRGGQSRVVGYRNGWSWS